MNPELIQSLSFLIVFILFIIKVYYCYISKNKLEEIINLYFEEKYGENIEISELSITDKLKYRVPIGIFKYNSHHFFKLSTNYVRRVDINITDDNTNVIYVDIEVKKREIISVTEFAKYEL